MIGIITAIEEEAQALLGIMQVKSATETAGIRFWTGTIERRRRHHGPGRRGQGPGSHGHHPAH